MTKAVEAVLSIEVVCRKCKKRRGLKHDVFLQMDPEVGSEVPFFLCPKCWLDYDGFDGPSPTSVVNLTSSAMLMEPHAEGVP